MLLGVIAQFEKASLVAKLKAARERKHKATDAAIGQVGASHFAASQNSTDARSLKGRTRAPRRSLETSDAKSSP